MRKKNSKKPFFLFNLPNGLKAVFWPLEGVNTVAVYLSIKAGSWYETEIKRGIFHFLEHVLAHGTKIYPSFTQISLKQEELGISASDTVGGLNSQFSWRTPKETFTETLRLLSEYIFRPIFPQEGIEKERKIILQEYFSRWDSPNSRFLQRLRENYLGKNHPYTYDSLGTKETIESITREDLVSAHQEYYSPRGMTLAIVGNLKPSLVEQEIRAFFSQQNKGKDVRIVTSLPNFSKKLFFQEERLNQVVFTAWFPIFRHKIDDWQKRYAGSMISYFLGGSRRSRLLLLLREKEPLAYSAGTGFTSTSLVGDVMHVDFSASLENTARIIEVIKIEIEKIKSGEFTQEEFLAAQKYYLYQISMNNDSVWTIAGNLSADLSLRKKIYLPEDLQRKVKKVTREDLIDAAKEIFDFKRVNIGLMSSQKNIKSLKKLSIEQIF